MTLAAHLTFPGTCAAAFRFYERVLDAEVGLLQTYGESPGAEHVAPEWRAKIVHGSITIDGRELLGADVRPEQYDGRAASTCCSPSRALRRRTSSSTRWPRTAP